MLVKFGGFCRSSCFLKPLLLVLRFRLRTQEDCLNRCIQLWLSRQIQFEVLRNYELPVQWSNEYFPLVQLPLCLKRLFKDSVHSYD